MTLVEPPEAVEASGARFDGSDLMPPEVGQGTFWEGMVRLFQEGPDSAEQILADIEASWLELEQEASAGS